MKGNKSRGSAQLILVIFLILIAGIFVFSNFRTVAPQKSKAAARNMRVLEIKYVYNGGNSNTIQTLTDGLIARLVKSSKFHENVNPSASPVLPGIDIVQTFTRQAPRPAPDPGKGWESVYNKILAKDNICSLVESQNIDQVWLWVDSVHDKYPGLEYVISSKYFRGDTARYAAIPSTLLCGEKSFIMMGFDYSRGVGEAQHSFGHMFEALITNIQTEDLFRNRFMGDNANGFPRANRCGTVHLPPNGKKDYDYSNKTVVNTFCEDWNPEGTGVKSSYNCNRWNCTQDGYLTWWMQNFPNVSANLTYQGKVIPSWWSFVVDLENSIKNAINAGYFINKALVDKIPPSQVSSTLSVTYPNSGNNSFSFSDNYTNSRRIMLVSASYRSPAKGDGDKISNLTYGNKQLTFIRRDRAGEYVTELFYLVNPDYSGTINIAYSGNVVDKVINVTTYHDIDTATPLELSIGSGGTKESFTGQAISNEASINVASKQNDIIHAVISTYTGGYNYLSVNDDQRGVSVGNTINVLGAVLLAPASSANVTNRVGWKASVDWPWAISAVAIRKANVPEVDIKANGLNGPITIDYAQTLNLNWSSVNSTSCVASGAWTGSKALNSSVSITNVKNSGVYTLTCTGPLGDASDSVTVNVKPPYDTSICWDRTYGSGNFRYWSDQCKGVFNLYTANEKGVLMCSLDASSKGPINITLLPEYKLSPSELTQFNYWNSAGKPKTLCQ